MSSRMTMAMTPAECRRAVTVPGCATKIRMVILVPSTLWNHGRNAPTINPAAPRSVSTTRTARLPAPAILDAGATAVGPV